MNHWAFIRMSLSLGVVVALMTFPKISWAGICSTETLPVSSDAPAGEDNEGSTVTPIEAPSTDKICHQSTIDTNRLTLSETIDLVGVPFYLNYSSDRVIGRTVSFEVKIPTFYSGLDSSITAMDISVQYGDRFFKNHFIAGQSAPIDLIWDGKDSAGNLQEGSIPISIQWLYQHQDGTVTTYSEQFGFGNFQAKALGLGGWTPSIVHFLDVNRGSNNAILYLGGSGSQRVSKSALKPSGGGYAAVSADGAELYLFDNGGHHLSTKNALTGDTKYSFAYDSTGRIAKIVDHFGNKTSFVYQGKRIQMVSPYGQVTEMALDDGGWLAGVTNPKKEAIVITMGPQGLMTAFQKPRGQTNHYYYDTAGYLQKDEGPLGKFIAFSRAFSSATGRQTVVATTALGKVTHYESYPKADGKDTTLKSTSGSAFNDYYVPKSVVAHSDSYGDSSQKALADDPRFGWELPYSAEQKYQERNGPVKVTTQKKSVSRQDPKSWFSIDSLSTTTVEQNDPARTSSSVYVAANRTITSKSPLGKVVVQSLNADSQLSYLQLGKLVPTSFSYDQRGRLTAVSNGVRSSVMSYNDQGYLAKSTDALGRTVQYSYDEAGRVTVQTLADGSIIRMSYDADGNMVSITPPSRPAHNFMFDALGFVSEYLPPVVTAGVTGATTYEYNLDKQLTAIHRPNGKTVTINYDFSTGHQIP